MNLQCHVSDLSRRSNGHTGAKADDEPGALRIPVPDRPGQHFSLWFPEIIWRKSEASKTPARPRSYQDAFEAFSVFHMKSPEWVNTPWVETGTGSLQRSLIFSAGFVRCSVRSKQNELLLEMTVSNSTDEVWLDCFAEICLSLSPSTDFADQTRERTYGRVHGQWAPLATVSAGSPNPLHNTYLAIPERPFLKECLWDWWADAFPVQLDHPLIAVCDRSNSAVIAIEFDPCNGYCNNLDPNMACIHSDPYVGTIAPFAERTAFGRIVYFRGRLEDLTRNLPARAARAARETG